MIKYRKTFDEVSLNWKKTIYRIEANFRATHSLLSVVHSYHVGTEGNNKLDSFNELRDY